MCALAVFMPRKGAGAQRNGAIAGCARGPNGNAFRRSLRHDSSMMAGKRFGQNLTRGLVRSGNVSCRENAVPVLDPDGWVRVLNRTTGDSTAVSNDIEPQ